MQKAVFLDRDGVINEAEGFVTNSDEIKLIGGAAEGIKLLNSIGMKVIVVTNQPQVARGLCTENDVERINRKISGELLAQGAKVDAFYFCPHHPEKHHADIPEHAVKYRVDCSCRKPLPGMIRKAAADFGIDIKSSYMVGDQTFDIKAAENAGCRSILVTTGKAGSDKKYDITPDFVCSDLKSACTLIKGISELKTVILAGGKGERLKPLTENMPKPMIPIGSKPLLEHLINLSKSHGINDIIIAGHYLFGSIKDYFGDGSGLGVRIEYVNDGPEPAGSGGAIRNCSHLLPENFIVLSGDVFTNIDLWELVKFHFSRKGLATLVVRETDHPQDSDIIEVGSDLKAVKFYPKNSREKKGNIGNVGIFAFSKGIMDFIQGARPNLERDAVAASISTGKVYCYINKNYYIKDTGTHERYRVVQDDARRLGLA